MVNRAMRAAAALALLAVAAVSLPAAAAVRAQGASGTLHTLTLADNGSTLTIPVGDSVELKLGTDRDWSNVAVSDVTILHRPPVLLVRDVQGLWNAAAPGSATITATGDLPCRSATPPCAAPSIQFQTTVNVVPAGSGGPPSTSGRTITLTMDDNHAALTIASGDSVALVLGTMYKWGSPSVSDASVLRRQTLPLPLGEQGVWSAAGPGTATIDATGGANCAPGVPCPQFALLFEATVTVTAAPGPAGNVATAAGWNLVGAPDGTTLPVDANAWDPQAGSYTSVPAGTALQGGRGYWAFFGAPSSVSLAPTARTTARIVAPAGAWVLVGNPSGRAPAQVSGADTVYTWNAATGSYVQGTTLAPGAGAWAISGAGGTITVTAGS